MTTKGKTDRKATALVPCGMSPAPSFDDDQGSDEPKTCKAKNGTATLGGSCPISNATLIQGLDGAEDGAESCSMANHTMILDLETLDQGQDGFLNQLCPIGTNSTMIVDPEQGEDGGEEQSCPAIPEGVIITPLADQGTYESANDSCPLLGPKFAI